MRTLARQVMCLLLIAAVPALAAAFWHPNRPAWTRPALAEGEVRLSDVQVWTEPVLWIDARSRAAYAAGHLPGALWLSEDAWDEGVMAVLEVWQPGTRIVVYCDGGACQASHDVAARLRDEAALDEVYVLHGGWDALREAAP